MIEFFFEDFLSFDFPRDKFIKKTTYIIDKEGFKPSFINMVFCSDNYLLGINKEHLQHDFFTDIITFNYNSENLISGDLFISIDRVKENAATQKTNFLLELERVIYHGVLHLCGFNDKSTIEIKQMRQKEDLYLNHDVSRET